MRHFYETEEYREARAEKIRVTGDKCEQCKRPRGEGYTASGGFWLSVDGWRDQNGALTDEPQLRRLPREIKRWVLTLCHLDRDPSNNDPLNLKLLCASCHLRYDLSQHQHNRLRTAAEAHHQQWLLEEFADRIPAMKGLKTQ